MKHLMIMLVAAMMILSSCGEKKEEVKTTDATKEEVKTGEAKTEEVKVEEKKSESKPAYSFTMSKSVWVCDFCSLTKTSDSSISGKCPNRSGLPHRATEVGKEGNETYTCENCNCKVQTSDTPKPGKCPQGSRHPTHSWKRQY